MLHELSIWECYIFFLSGILSHVYFGYITIELSITFGWMTFGIVSLSMNPSNPPSMQQVFVPTLVYLMQRTLAIISLVAACYHFNLKPKTQDFFDSLRSPITCNNGPIKTTPQSFWSWINSSLINRDQAILSRK